MVGNGCFFLFLPLKSEAAFDVGYLMDDTNSSSERCVLETQYMRINPYVERTVEKPFEISGRSVVLKMMVSEMVSRISSLCTPSAHAEFKIKHFQWTPGAAAGFLPS